MCFLVDVEYQCRQHLFPYAKGGRGRLIKCFLDQIDQDEVGVMRAPGRTRPTCPHCKKDIGIVRIILDCPALKPNQGAVRNVVT